MRPQRKRAASVAAETTPTSSREHQSHPKPRAVAVVDSTTKRPRANNASKPLAFWRPFARVVATAVLVACIAGALIIPTAVVGFGVWMSDTHPLWFPVYLVAILTIVIGFLVGELQR